VEREIARLNIERFRKLLAAEIDEVKRQMVLRLLAEEEAKLETLKAEAEEGKPQSLE
jgi:hypothetical protein